MNTNCKDKIQLIIKEYYDRSTLDINFLNTCFNKFITHSYISIYGYYLNKFIDKQCSLLEIGILWGNSFYVWNKLFKDCNITMVDKEDRICNEIEGNVLYETIISNFSYEKFIQTKTVRNYCVFGDAYTSKLSDVCKDLQPNGYDIIIEDGSHAIHDQLFVLKNYIGLLKDTGLMFIEDIQSIENAKILMRQAKQLKLKYKLFDLRSLKNRYDDILLLVQKDVNRH